jgi:hypothetical protein
MNGYGETYDFGRPLTAIPADTTFMHDMSQISLDVFEGIRAYIMGRMGRRGPLPIHFCPFLIFVLCTYSIPSTRWTGFYTTFRRSTIAARLSTYTPYLQPQ